MIVYSCSKPSHKSLSSSPNVALVFVECGVPSGFITSHKTRKLVIPVSSKGLPYNRTGFKTQSEKLPSACWVDDPSKDHSGQSLTLLTESFTILTLLLRLGSGLYPSSQTYSSFVFIFYLNYIKPLYIKRSIFRDHISVLHLPLKF